MEDTTGGETLLAHLAGKLSSRHEDIAVEALGYILRSKPAVGVLEAVLRDGDADIGRIASFRTQVGEGQTRPDLVGFDEQEGGECVLIEAKFWAGLTDNQPKGYLDRLDPGKALLFVAPESRLETLWSKLCCLAGVEGSRCDAGKPIRSTLTEERKHLMLISWTRLLDRLEGVGDAQSRLEIQQLRGLADRVDASEFLPLRQEEFAPEIPRRIRGLQRLVDDATNRAVDQGYADISGLRVTPMIHGYGRYLSLRGGGAWFGIASDLWARGSYPDTPLWLRFWKWGGEANEAQWPRTRTALGRLMRKDQPSAFELHGGIIVPIYLPTEVEYDAVLDAVVSRLQEIADLIEKNRT